LGTGLNKIFNTREWPFRCNFGSWGKALLAAGFKPKKFVPNGRKKGGRNKTRKQIKTNFGYVKLFEPSHPLANKNGYVLEHRKILFDNGALVDSNKVVHHKNGNKTDNSIENLVVLSSAEHTSLHFKNKKIPRIGSAVCAGSGCQTLQKSKYNLCRKHYQRQWDQEKNRNKRHYESPELLEKK